MASIGRKLTLIQGLTASLFLVVSAVGIGAAQTSRLTFATHGLELNRITSVEEIADLLSENRIAEAYMIFRSAAESRALLAKRNGELDGELNTLKGLGLHGAQGAAIARLDSAWRDYRIDQRRLVTLAESGRRAEAIQAFSGPLELRFNQVDWMADTLIGEITEESELSTRHAVGAADVVMVFVILSCSVGILLGLAMMYFVRARIVAPLAAVTGSLSDLAAGDIDVVVTGGDRNDEIGAMVRALEVFRTHAARLETAHRQTREAQDLAESMARHDALTGLPNRRLFIEALTRATQGEDHCAVLLLDLDRFKPINDVYGHDAGDTVLCALSDRFAAHRDELGMVARLGGDEFAVVLPTGSGPERAVRAAELITKIVSLPIQLGDTFIEVGATIGIALFPQDGREPSALLHAADLAMYQAKGSESARFRFFESSMHQQVQDRALLDADLRRAITAGEIQPHYQPLVSIDDGAVIGFEILSRWHHPKRGIIMPDMFIPAADERGLLTEMTYNVLRQVCLDAKSWPRHLKLSLNLSPSQLVDPLLAPRILAILTQGCIAPKRLEIEVTENALITDLEATKAVLAAFQGMGMTIALDDFGTGYSSLYHLRDLKFDKIKIDKSFIHALDAGGESLKIVAAMIGLGKSLDMTTTAEGIEDAEQWSRLSKLGCDIGQGYLFGKAMTADQASILLDHPGENVSNALAEAAEPQQGGLYSRA